MISLSPIQQPDEPAITKFINSINECYCNGGIIFKQFVLNKDELCDTIFHNHKSCRNWVNKILTSQTLQNEIPELDDIQEIQFKDNFWRTDIFSLPGDLAALIYHGGAYSDDSISCVDAYSIALNFTKAISNNRYSEFHMFSLGWEWSSWFYNIVWDYSVLLFDKKNNVVTLICITDTD